MSTTRADLRRRVLGWRAAERREQALRAREGPPDPVAALDAAFELHELFAPESNEADMIRNLETTSARVAWRKLRDRLAYRPATASPR